MWQIGVTRPPVPATDQVVRAVGVSGVCRHAGHVSGHHRQDSARVRRRRRRDVHLGS